MDIAKESLVVKGFGASFQNLNGLYEVAPTCCGRVSYQKVGRKGTAYIYFWDKDDGMKGWWIAPKVNGDVAWARHPSASTTPPKQGWFAPWESNVADRNVFIGLKRSLPPPTVSAKKQKTEEEIEVESNLIAEAIGEIEGHITSCVNLVDKLKDIAVTFSCEVIDHMPADDVLETKSRAEATGKEAQEEICKIRKLCDATRTQNEQCRSDPKNEIWNKLGEFYKQLQEMSKDINKNLSNVARGSQNALKTKREEKQLAAQKAQLVAAQKVIAFRIIAKPISAAVDEMTFEELGEAESILLAMMDAIAKDSSLVQESAAQAFRTTTSALRVLLKAVKEKQQDIRLGKDAREDELGAILARAIQEYMEREKMDEDALFARIAQGESLTGAQLEEFAESLELEKYSEELLASLFGRILVAAGKDSLTKDEFFMYVANALYSVCSDTIMEDEGQKKKVENGDIVEVIEGPIGEPLKARCKLMDGTTGWIPFKALQRISPHFSVLQETVLTDRHELKGFNVVTRVHPGMKLFAEKRPMIDHTTKLLRVPVKIEGEESRGYVTVRGNRGARLLKQEVAVSAENSVAAKELTDDDWAKMVLENTRTVRTDLVSRIDEITSLRADCEQKCVNLEALSDGWTAEVLEETSKAAVEAWGKVDSLIQALAGKLAVQSSELGHACKVEGPLSEIKATVDDVQKRLLEAKSAHHECTKRARSVNKKLMHELSQQKRAAELAVEEEVINATINESIGRKELVIGMQSRLDVAEEAGLLALEETIGCADEMVSSMRGWMDTIRKEGNAKKLSKALGELSTCLSRLNVLANSRKAQLTNMRLRLEENGAILVAKALRDHMEMASISEADLFAQLTKESGGVLKVSAVQEFLATQKVDLSTSIIEAILKKISLHGLVELELPEFLFLTKPYYRVMKVTSLTASLSKTSTKICSLPVDDTVIVLSPAESDVADCRVRVLYGDKEGYVTIRDRVTVLEPLSYFYKVTKETLMTNKFEMHDFQPVRRLRIGDILRARSPPSEEKASRLWRVEVVALLPKDSARKALLSENSGFATIRGNQGTPFLRCVKVGGLDLELPGKVEE